MRHEAIGLNFVDTLFRDGTFGVPMPFNMGVEAAGVVEAVGAEVKGMKAGDRVAYFFSFGAYADVRLWGRLSSFPERTQLDEDGECRKGLASGCSGGMRLGTGRYVFSSILRPMDKG